MRSLKNSISFYNEWKQLSSNCFPIHWAPLVLQENRTKLLKPNNLNNIHAVERIEIKEIFY